MTVEDLVDDYWNPHSPSSLHMEHGSGHSLAPLLSALKHWLKLDEKANPIRNRRINGSQVKVVCNLRPKPESAPEKEDKRKKKKGDKKN